MKKYYLLFYFLILLMYNGFAQNKIIQIQGQVVDALNNQALPFAHINLPGTGIGTLSNNSGTFSLKLEEQYLKDTLMVSYLGYESAQLPIIKAGQGDLKIKLEVQTQMLNEIVVKPIDGLDLIQEAIFKIPENFANEPHLKRGFYRLVSRDEEQFFHLSEAVFDVYLREYGKKSNDQLKLLKARSIKDETKTLGIDLGLKPYLIFEYDMVSDVLHSEILSKCGLKNHIFEWKGRTTIQSKEVHEIWFDQKDGIRKGLFKGKIYLDAESLAIVHINYGFSPKGRQYLKFGDAATRALLGITGVKIDILDYNFEVWYQQIEHRWYLSHVRNNTILDIQSTRDNYSYQPNIQVDYMIMELEREEVKAFANHETLGNGKLIHYQDKDMREDFWEEYNIILSDYSFVEIAKTIRNRNKEAAAEKEE